MRILISPAKKMVVDTDTYAVSGLPVFIKDTEMISQTIRKLSYDEAKTMWQCNDKISKINYKRFEEMDLKRNLTPAILSYQGLQYQHMAPSVFTEEALNYMNANLRILSGFYGVLAPFDGVVPYRLEMQAELAVMGKKDLYAYWQDRIYKEIIKDQNTIVNLASNEYSKVIKRFVTPDVRYITCVFGELVGGKVKQKATFAKMARGEMVRFMSENNVTTLEEMKAFTSLGFAYSEEYSDEKEMVFLLTK